MKIYFDESGQSGCVLQKDDILNFQKQPTFAIGAVAVRDKNAEDKLSGCPYFFIRFGEIPQALFVFLPQIKNALFFGICFIW